jgi:hypothetical protein
MGDVVVPEPITLRKDADDGVRIRGAMMQRQAPTPQAARCDRSYPHFHGIASDRGGWNLRISGLFSAQRLVEKGVS